MNKAGVGHDQTYIQFLEKKQCMNMIETILIPLKKKYR